MSDKASKKSGGVPSLFASTISDTDKLGKRRFSSAHKYVQKDIDLGSVVRSDLKDKLSSRIGGGGANRQMNSNGRKKGGLDIFALMDSAMETGPTEEAKQRARDEAAAQKAKEEDPILPKPKKVAKKKAKSFSPAKSSEVPILFASVKNDSSSSTREPAWKTRMKDRLTDDSSKTTTAVSNRKEIEELSEAKNDMMTSIPEETEVKRGIARKKSGSAERTSALNILGAIDSAMETGATDEAKEKAREEAAAKKTTEAFVSPRKVVKKKAKSFSPASSSPGGVPILFSSKVGSPSGANIEPAWKVRLREAQNKEAAATAQELGQPSALDKALNEIETPQVNDKPQIDKIADRIDRPQIDGKRGKEDEPHTDRKVDLVEEPQTDKRANKHDEPPLEKTPKEDDERAVDKVPDSTDPLMPDERDKSDDDDDEFSVSISDVDTETDDEDEEAPQNNVKPVMQATSFSNEKQDSDRAPSISPTTTSTVRNSPTRKTPVSPVQNSSFAQFSPVLSVSPMQSPEPVVQQSMSSKVESPRRSPPRKDADNVSKSLAALATSGKAPEVELTKAESPNLSPRNETLPDLSLSTALGPKSPLISQHDSSSKSLNFANDQSETEQTQQMTDAPAVSATSNNHRSKSSLDDSNSDSSDDAEANYPSAFKFTAKPTTTFYRDSDSDDSSSSDDSNALRGFQFASDDGGFTGLPSADFEFLIDDDTETKQFIFSLKDELVSHHTADWYEEKINEAGKRLQISLANHKLQQAELKKLVDRKKESIADVFEVKMDSHRRMGAKQSKSFQKVYEEEQKIVETLRKENKRVRAELNKLPKQIKETKESIKNLEAANTEIEGHLESLGKFSKKLERDHEKLQASSAQCRDVYLPRYRNELRHREFEIDVETRIKNLYRNCILKISRHIGVRKPELQEAINEFFLETEADVNPKFNPKILFAGESDSNSSSSDSDSDSSSSSSDSDSD